MSYPRSRTGFLRIAFTDCFIDSLLVMRRPRITAMSRQDGGARPETISTAADVLQQNLHGNGRNGVGMLLNVHAPGRCEFACYPLIGPCQALFQRDLWLPFQHFTQTGVIAVAATHTLWFRDVVTLADALAGNPGNDVDQFVDRDHAVLSQIDRIAMIALHQPVNTFDTIVDVAIRSGLSTVSPDFNVVTIIGQRNLATNCRRRFFAAAVIRPQRTKDVMKPHHPRVQSKIFGVVTADAFHIELLPTIAVFRVGRICVLFLQRSDIRVLLFETGIDARARSIEVTLDSILSSGFDRMQIHERAIAHDLGLVTLDKSDPAHVRSQAIDMVNAARGLQAAFPLRQIEELEFLGRSAFVLWLFDIHAAHPIAALDQILRQMMTDETTRAGNQYPNLFCHNIVSFPSE